VTPGKAGTASPVTGKQVAENKEVIFDAITIWPRLLLFLLCNADVAITLLRGEDKIAYLTDSAKANLTTVSGETEGSACLR